MSNNYRVRTSYCWERKRMRALIQNQLQTYSTRRGKREIEMKCAKNSVLITRYWQFYLKFSYINTNPLTDQSSFIFLLKTTREKNSFYFNGFFFLTFVTRSTCSLNVINVINVPSFISTFAFRSSLYYFIFYVCMEKNRIGHELKSEPKNQHAINNIYV